MLRSMKRLQSPFKRTVVLDGHKTSINVEPEFWDQLRLITLERQTTMAKLITEIDRIGRLLPPQGPGRHRVRTLSAAIRIFVLQEVLVRADNPIEHATQRTSFQTQVAHFRFSNRPFEVKRFQTIRRCGAWGQRFVGTRPWPHGRLVIGEDVGSTLAARQLGVRPSSDGSM